jgi:hypothetical protein
VPFSALGTGWYLVSFSDAGYAKPPSMPLDVSQLNYSGGIRVDPNSVSFLVSASPGEQLPLQLTGPGCLSWTDTGTASCGESYSAFSEGDSVSFGSAGIGPAYITVRPTPFTNYVCNAQNFNASGAPGTLTYKWTASDGASITTSGSRNESAQITFSNPGTATITVQAGPLSATANGTVIGPTNIITQTQATIPADQGRKIVGVGEQVQLTLSPTFGGTVTWACPDGDGSLSAYTGNLVTFFAPDHQSITDIQATYACLTTPFSVTINTVEPDHETGVKYGADWTFPPGTQGAGMDITVTMQPTSVSFENCEIQEVPGPATGISGYFTNFPPATLSHNPTNVWVAVLSSNVEQGVDQAALSGFDPPPPWSTGGFQWIIPVQWRVRGGSDIGTLRVPRQEIFSITGSDGTTTITKLGCSVTRRP